MKKLFITTAIAAMLLFSSLSANAACPLQNTNGFKHKPHEHQNMHKPLTQEQKAEMEKRKAELDKLLGITDAQKAQLKAIHEKSKAEIAPKIKQLSEAEYELGVLIRKEKNKQIYGINTFENATLSGKSIEQLRKEVKTLRNEIYQVKQANFEESQKVFTDEQKQKLEQLRKEKMQNKRKMHKHHRGAFFKYDKKPPVPPVEK